MLILQAQNLHNFNSSRLKIGYPGTFVWKILSLHKKLGCLKVHILYLFKRTLSQVSVHSFGHCSKCTKIILIILFFPFLFCLEIYPIILWSSSSLSSPQVGGFVLRRASVMFSAWPMPKWKEPNVPADTPGVVSQNGPFPFVRLFVITMAERQHNTQRPTFSSDFLWVMCMFLSFCRYANIFSAINCHCYPFPNLYQ